MYIVSNDTRQVQIDLFKFHRNNENFVRSSESSVNTCLKIYKIPIDVTLSLK